MLQQKRHNCKVAETHNRQLEPPLSDLLHQSSLCLMSRLQRLAIADLIGIHWGTFPVIEVILQVSISFAKLELLQEHLILHEIQGIEHIKTFLLNTNYKVPMLISSYTTQLTFRKKQYRVTGSTWVLLLKTVNYWSHSNVCFKIWPN